MNMGSNSYLLPVFISKKTKKTKHVKKRRRKPVKVWRLFVYFLIYLTLMNVFCISTSVVLHEMGHVLVGIYYGCEGRAIIFDLGAEGPYSELVCPPDINEDAILFGGFLLVVPFGLVFLIFKNHPIKNFILVILGLAIILSGLDLLRLYGSVVLLYFSSILGIILIMAGETFLVEMHIRGIKKRRSMLF